MEENEIPEKPTEKDPQLARLEQIYLKKNLNYYPEKQPEQTFDKLTWTEADLEHLRKQRGENGQDTEEEADEEIRRSTAVKAAINRRTQKAFKDEMAEWWRTQSHNTNRQINIFILVNAVAALYSVVKLLLFTPSFLLFFVFLHRWVVFQILKIWFPRQRDLKDRIASFKYWMPALDMAVIAWLPLKLCLSTVLLNSDVGSPSDPERLSSGLDLCLVTLFYVNYKVLRTWFWQ